MPKYRAGEGSSRTAGWETVTTYKIGPSGKGTVKTLSRISDRAEVVLRQEKLASTVSVDSGIKKVTRMVGGAAVATSVIIPLATGRLDPHQTVALLVASGALLSFGPRGRKNS
ncbi:hypothetical protein KKD61_02480 [Patescibacteria group bacterium]|nr:hypothetical protein [Patescibacteria group bacterium]